MLEVFYDGACPTCIRIARLIGRVDKDEKIILTNLRENPGAIAFYDIDFFEALKKIHAVSEGGGVYTGYDVFLAVLAALGWAKLSTLLRFFPLYYLGVGTYKMLNFIK